MADFPTVQPSLPTNDRLLAYVADLELEVDRLRRQGRFIEKSTTATLSSILKLCAVPNSGDANNNLAEVGTAARFLSEVVKDLHDSPGYHPAHDQVVAIAVRPLIEQVFRWQQRLTDSRGVTLQLELEIDHAEWFPARFRHILDNLFANALRYHNPAATRPWVSVGMRAAVSGYELRISGNGIGPLPGEEGRVLELFYRSTPARNVGFGAGLAVVKLLIEQSGGTLIASSREDSGTDFVLTLPRYDLLDYLE